MYDLIQATLTAAIEFTAVAGLTGMAAHAIWKQHANWMTAYCPSVKPYTPDTETEEVATTEPQPAPEIPARALRCGVAQIADPWEAPITTSTRRWVSRQPQPIMPVLALCPVKEVKPVAWSQPTPIDLNALDAATLRKLCTQHGIAWRDVRGKNRHATKAMMIFQLNQQTAA